MSHHLLIQKGGIALQTGRIPAEPWRDSWGTQAGSLRDPGRIPLRPRKWQRRVYKKVKVFQIS